MRTAFSLLLLVHGIAHLVGFLVPWNLLVAEETPYKTTLLAGRLDVGETGIRVVGVLWLLTALAFAASSWTLWRDQPWALPLVAGVTVASLVLSVLSWPDARIGVLIDGFILASLWVAGYLG